MELLANSSISLCICLSVHLIIQDTHTHTHTHTYIHIYIYIYIYMYVCVRVYRYVCVSVCLCLCVGGLYRQTSIYINLFVYMKKLTDKQCQISFLKLLLMSTGFSLMPLSKSVYFND